MARKRYDDKFRANAIVMLQAAGWPNQDGALTRVAKNINVPLTTLSRWAKNESNPAPAELVTEKKNDLRDLLRREIGLALNEADHARSDASYRDLMTAVGIMVDKLQLLNDEPTENVNTRIVIEYAKPDANENDNAA